MIKEYWNNTTRKQQWFGSVILCLQNQILLVWKKVKIYQMIYYLSKQKYHGKIKISKE
jgi:hypothetical protein